MFLLVLSWHSNLTLLRADEDITGTIFLKPIYGGHFDISKKLGK